MRSLPIAAAAAAAVVGSALAFAQDPAQQKTTTATETKTATKEAAPAAASSELNDLKSRGSYLIGFNIGNQFKGQGLDIDPDLLTKGIKDALAGTKPPLSDAAIKETFQALQQQAQAKQAEQQKAMQAEAAKVGGANKQEGDAFLAANAKKPGVTTLPSGLQYKVLKEGTGHSPKASDVATVHYEGKLINGQVFDSSYKRGEPTQFQPNQVIRGWTEALQLMKTGSEWELYIPSDLAYGPGGNRGIPPNSTLVFKVELIAVNGQK
ncbi:MAG TPA: FKBP-type peptidyl-prolyl cis-trans isomerase [Isosphaeraceae bacterium]